MIGLAVGIVVLAFASLIYGPVRLAPREILQGLLGTASDPVIVTIVRDLRLPRMLLALCIGAGLGIAGAAYQALFRNPLADPFVVGASSGAAAGAALVIVSGWAGTAVGFGPASMGGFFGAIASVLLVYSLAAASRLPAVTVLLAGAVVSTMLGAFVWLMMAMSDAQMPRIVAWLMGGLAGRGWETARAACPLILGGTLLLGVLGRPLDLVRCGDDTARSLGVPVHGLMVVILAVASLIVAAAVASGGVIGFIGLAAPHIARRFVGAAHARLLPASAIVGGGLLLAADALARTAVAPLELPLGVVTALLGGPLFLVVLRRHGAVGMEGDR